ncbi:lipoprotein [Gordonia phage Clawz]|uniref:Lipoprotein n=1 Tax=Gordonia phage Clawz TaxID=2743910 RepID=A0AAE7F8C7_9CAUD|nr:lipoprotein [Gordonia phage Clawz]QKY79924.1 lipoprotein [Gordonia phage Clawz]
MRKTITAAVAVAAIIGLAACEPLDDASAPNKNSEYTVQVENESMTKQQSNAVRKAQDYLSTSAFSRTGLIDQLKFEGFAPADAEYAVDNISVDWNEQAVKKAKEYMNTSAFSESSLADQLQFDGFTAEQARHGAQSQF